MIDTTNGRITLTAKCKLFCIVVIILVAIESFSVYVWESKQMSHKQYVPHPRITYQHTNQSKESMGLFYELPNGKFRLTRRGQKELDRRLELASDKKIILIWIPMFGVKSDKSVSREKCGNCEVTYDRSKINDNRTGAVVFHFDALRKSNMPEKRKLNHLYIYWDMESTATLKVIRGHSLKWEDSFKFNGTMNYRLDSMFYSSYEHTGSVEDFLQNNTYSPEDVLKMKTKFAVALVSDCGITHGAKKRIKMLRELLSFDIGFEGFGGCLPGGHNFAHGLSRDTTEFRNEVRKYKFFMAYENSYHCKDYVSEKYFNNAILSLAVPVVWGSKRKDYEAVGPPRSFIFAEDFSSMRELADYLLYLDKNDTAYLEYLQWYKMPVADLPQYGRALEFCHICQTLHGINTDDIYSPKFDRNNMQRPLFTEGVSHRTEEHLIDWFYGEDYPECFD